MIRNNVEIRPFENCIKKVKYTKKVASQDFKESGRFPIVSQEEAFISGYWDNPDDVFSIDGPVVIFGDHSRHVKYVDFDFVIGADGVKILAPVDDINAKYFYYYLKSQRIQSLGYSRHYKVLKEKMVPVPSLADQQRIVDELDLLSGIVEKKNAQLKTLDDLAMSVFDETFDCDVHNWNEKPLVNCVNKVKYTTKLHTKDFLKNGKFPIISQEEEFISGYWNSPEDLFRVKKPVVIFGDHTRVLKYIDFDFVLGADGVRILEPIDELNPQYLYYFLRSNPVENLGYSRHFKLLKEKMVVIPPVSMQKVFAEKVKSINKQKIVIGSSLRVATELLNSRIDTYFNV